MQQVQKEKQNTLDKKMSKLNISWKSRYKVLADKRSLTRSF